MKEVRLFEKKGYRVSVVAFNLHNWTNEREAELHKEFKEVSFNYLETTSKHFVKWIFSTLLERISRILIHLSPSSTALAGMATSKRSWLLLQWTKAYKEKVDLIIAHNPASFYPAYQLSKRIKVPFAIDVEDYHPGENNSESEKKASSILMRKLLKKTSYTSFASPLIKTHTEQLLMSDNNGRFLTINNTFPEDEFQTPVNGQPSSDKLQIVWFSQFIDYGRGLERILPSLDALKDTLDLTLIGSIRISFFRNELEHRKYIKCPGSLSQRELNKLLSVYDVGLAIEDKNADLNRNICLTNKIWSYFQAGLYIVATDTDAQTSFLRKFNDHGLCTSLDPDDLRKTFERLKRDKEKIRATRQQRFQDASNYSWEKESEVLVKTLHEIL